MKVVINNEIKMEAAVESLNYYTTQQKIIEVLFNQSLITTTKCL